MRSYELTGKRCYDHLGGKLGAELFDFLVLQKWIELKEGTTATYAEPCPSAGFPACRLLPLHSDAPLLSDGKTLTGQRSEHPERFSQFCRQAGIRLPPRSLYRMEYRTGTFTDGAQR